MSRFLIAAIALAVMGCSTSPASNVQHAPLACDETLAARFRPDDQARVIAVHQFRAGDPIVLSEPVMNMTPRVQHDVCMVKLVVGPGNPGPVGAPSTSQGIGIEVWLPSPANWTGRIHNMGGGGWVGGVHTVPDRVAWMYAAFTADREGAVSSQTDAGHTVTDGSWGMNPDGSLATQLWTDYAHRALHEQAEKTKALAQAFYGRAHTFAYFSGSSTGGRQANMLAQRYPDDYDGLIGNLGALYFADFALGGLYRGVVVERELEGVNLTEAQMDLASNAAIHACDVVGGEHLGYIFDNAACRYDPTDDRNVLCRSAGGRSGTSDCLTVAQANVLNRVWYGATVDGSVPSPATDNGINLSLESPRDWYGFPRGTSLYNYYYTRGPGAMMLRAMSSADANGAASRGNTERVGDARTPQPIAGSFGGDIVALVLGDSSYADPTFRNATGDGEGRWRELTYRQLSEVRQRARELDVQMGGWSTSNPDLSAFRDRGGKFISWHGWNDEAIPPLGTVRYYEAVMQRMGGAAAVQEFYRLYMVPGGGHESPQGTSNTQANPPRFDGGTQYQMLVNWVENGVAPPMRIDMSSPPNTPNAISQPACAYPQHARYLRGNPRLSESYVCS